MPFSQLDRFITGELLAPVWVSLPLFAIWLAAALGAGALLLRGRGFRSLWLAFTLGLVALAWCAVLLAPLWRFLPARLPELLLIPLAGFGACHLMRRLRERPAGRREVAVVAAAAAAFALFTAASAFFPPYGWDEQVYQTSLLRRYLAEGSFAVRPDNPYSAYPSLPHFALAWAAGSCGVELPRLATWAMASFLLAAFYRELRCRYTIFSAAAATLAVALSPLGFALGREFYTDLWSAGFAFSGALLLLPVSESPEPETDGRLRFLLAGVFAGAAVAVKLPGGGAALALGVLALGARRRIGWFLLGGVAAALPFFLRVWLATGDPCYPWFAALGDPTAAAVAEFHRALGRYRYGLEGIPGVALGWLFVAFDAKLYDGIVLGWQLPALLFAALGSWIVRRRRSGAPPFRERRDFAAAAMLTLYLFWSLTSQQSRFLLPLLLAAAWGAAAALDRMPFPKRRIAAGILLLAALAGFSLPHAYHYVVAWRHCAAARRNPAAHLAAVTRDPGYFAAMEALAGLPRNVRVLMLGERRTLYARCRCTLGDSLFQGARFTPPPVTAEEFAAGLRGFDYLYCGNSPVEIDRLEQYEPVRERMAGLVDELLRQGRLTPVFSFGGNHLMKISPPDARSGR